MNISQLSTKYNIRKLTPKDIDSIYELSIGNPLFYKYCPPYVTRESILDDMKALPPKMTYADKFYIGFFKDAKLIAIMDLIFNYPDQDTTFIGLFMMSKEEQGKGVGSDILKDCFRFIKDQGYSSIRLAFAKGNPQSETFWHKNGFTKTGVEKDNEDYIAVLMEKNLAE